MKKTPAVVAAVFREFAVAAFSFLAPSVASAQAPYLVKDIHPGPGSSGANVFTDVNGVLFFQASDGNGTIFMDATDGSHGVELWKSDGTAAGTSLVKDIRPGGGTSRPFNLVNFNRTLFFSANDGVSGEELWRSDGTASGTVLVKDINAGSGSSFPGNLRNVGGTLFFVASDGINGGELWALAAVLSPSEPIPTLSGWGYAAFCLLLVTVASVILRLSR